jgi:undecaprenyl-diphosphatase
MGADDARPWYHQRWWTVLAGFAISFGVGVASAEYTRSLGNWNHGLPWERALMYRVHTPLPGWLDTIMMICPWFGTNISLIPAVALIVWWLWKKQNSPNDAVRLGVVQIGSYLLNPSLKALFDRARPDMFVRRGWYGWSSYPSGHAIASVSVLLTLAIVLHRVKGWLWPYAITALIMFASAYSRVYLAVHWPTDVIAGALVGVVWLLVTSFAFRGEGIRAEVPST